MSARETFGVVVRATGLIVTLVSVGCLFPAVLSLIGGGPNVAGLLVFGVPALFVGLWLLRGAKAVVSFAFPDDTNDER